MNFKRIIGIVVIVIGIALVSVAYYIKQEVAAGEKKIIEGEKSVKKTDALFSLTPVTKDVGGGLTSSGKKKIAEGKKEVAYYSALAQWLQIGGIVLIVGGAVIVVLGKNSSRRKR